MPKKTPTPQTEPTPTQVILRKLMDSIRHHELANLDKTAILTALELVNAALVTYATSTRKPH